MADWGQVSRIVFFLGWILVTTSRLFQLVDYLINWHRRLQFRDVLQNSQVIRASIIIEYWNRRGCGWFIQSRAGQNITQQTTNQ